MKVIASNSHGHAKILDILTFGKTARKLVTSVKAIM